MATSETELSPTDKGIETEQASTTSIDAALHQAQEEAEKAKKKAEELAQLSLYDPSPLIRFDVDHNKLLYVNPAAFNRYSDIFRKGVEHPLLSDITEFALRAISQRRTCTREVSVGSLTYQQSITPNLLGGERIVTIYNHDITKLKQTEDILRQERERAESANRAKSDFLANVSHELRTPMSGVLGVAALLKDSHLDDEQKELVNTIMRSGESLMILLNDILDLSKIEAKELSLEQTPFNLAKSMNETVDLYTTLASKKNIDLHFHYNNVAPECFVGDPTRVRQIVTNLLGNAIKFTDKGSVSFDISSCGRDDGRVDMMFRIDDTGIGIDAKDMHKIFEKFMQADSTTTRKYGGTGLGLTICKLLAEAMGGKIGVESRIGRGSSFWFSIPLIVADVEQTARLSADEQQRMDASKGLPPEILSSTILIVDDHPVNLFLAKKLLMKFGFTKITTTEDGQSAIDKCAQENFDLVILDCQMPGIDGYEVSRILRQREEGSGKHLPIIAMTANAMIGDREKCFEAGMDDYVSKPINATRLTEVMIKWLGSGSLSAPPTVPVLKETLQIELANASGFADQSPLDMNHLRDYIGDDIEEQKIVARLFLDGATESITIMQNAIGAGDAIAWKKAAHKLKGSAANIGANPLRALCLQAEQEFENSTDSKTALLQRITDACDAIRAVFGE